MKIRIFTDGACSGNPGVGGWGALIMFPEHQSPMSGSEANTTNNRMELTAVVQPLYKVIKDWEDINEWDEFEGIEVISDSAYVVNGVNQKWIEAWKRNGWKTTNKEPVKNKELWIKLDKLILKAKEKEIKLDFIKVKGHAGNHFNEMVDKMAREEVNKIKGGKKVLQ